MSLEHHIELFRFIENYQKAYGNSPIIDEMMEAIGKSRGAIQNGLKWLEQHGWIRRHPYKKSHIEILRPSSIKVPIRGEIAAGYLSDACTNATDHLSFDAPWLRVDDFALKISGDSMIGDCIPDGAFVLMRTVPDGYSPKQGEIVAAWVRGAGLTLKRFYQQEHLVTLQPSNPAYEPIQLDLREQELKIQGVWLLTLNGSARFLLSGF